MIDLMASASERMIRRDRAPNESKLAEQVLDLLGDRLQKEVPEEATLERYTRAFDRFRAWAHCNGYKAMPASGVVVAAYLMALMSATSSVAKTEEAAEAIIYFHKDRGRYLDLSYVHAALTWACEAWDGARLLSGRSL
jgi:hypothetical protein